MQKKWRIKNFDEEQVAKFAETLGVKNLTAKILLQRGISDADKAKIFLNPETEQKFFDPFLMFGMSDAVERISVALERGEKICVYGDYDVDGMSGTAILTRTLRRLGGKVFPYIPRRVEGYGLNIPALEKISESGVKLLITVDCGISNAKEIAAAKNLDVIVTDHHLPALEKISGAVAVIDPHQPECNYPEKNLCGAGVAFKLSQALAKKISGSEPENYFTDIDLAALATVADVVPLTGENRKIVRLGLKEMSNSKCLGLNALVKISGLADKKIFAENVAFQIAPRLNSIGRLSSATTGLKLLLTDDPDEAQSIAEEIDETNTRRKKIEKETFLQADEKFKKLREESGGDLWSAVISGEGWNAGVIGLTAAKLAEKYNLPSIVVVNEGTLSRGSCRSIANFHMKNALDTMADLFENYGGHSQAAGFSLPTKLVPELKRRFENYSRSHMTDEDFRPVAEIDALIYPTLIDFQTAKEFENLEPCGTGNPAPVLACKNVRCADAKVIGADGTHLKFSVVPEEPDEKNFQSVGVIAFGCADLFPLVETEKIDLIYKPGIDSFQGEEYVKCFAQDISATGGEENFPTREQLVEIYKFLKFLRKKTSRFDRQNFVANLNAATKKNFSMYTVLNALDVFSEVGLIKFDGENFELPASQKKDLQDSRTFRLSGR